jgi:hypothetical protein
MAASSSRTGQKRTMTAATQVLWKRYQRPGKRAVDCGLWTVDWRLAECSSPSLPRCTAAVLRCCAAALWPCCLRALDEAHELLREREVFKALSAGLAVQASFSLACTVDRSRAACSSTRAEPLQQDGQTANVCAGDAAVGLLTLHSSVGRRQCSRVLGSRMHAHGGPPGYRAPLRSMGERSASISAATLRL